MWLKNIILNDFRNYRHINIDLHKELNIFIGDNGDGKTNILESIYFSSLLKSHRTNKIQNLINFDGTNFKLILNFVRDNGREINTEIIVNNLGKKQLNLNKQSISKITDFIGYIKVVMFSPEDMKLVKESPNIRRKFLDMNISQLDAVYLRDLIRYNKVLYLKNVLLKHKSVDDTLLDTYDEQLSLYNSEIIIKRYEFISNLNKIARDIHRDISLNCEELSIVYKTFVNSSFVNSEYRNGLRSLILDILRENRSSDKLRGNSSIGIHRDDFEILINGRGASQYSSQGQQRSSVVSIKLGIVNIIKNVTNEYPVLLLDDILSELDKNRRNFILNFIPNIQTFITSTELYENIVRPGNVFRISSGEII